MFYMQFCCEQMVKWFFNSEIKEGCPFDFRLMPDNAVNEIRPRMRIKNCGGIEMRKCPHCGSDIIISAPKVNIDTSEFLKEDGEDESAV